MTGAIFTDQSMRLLYERDNCTDTLHQYLLNSVFFYFFLFIVELITTNV